MFEELEMKLLLTTIYVSTVEDVSSDELTSLREAVEVANETPGEDTIAFDPLLHLPEINLELGEQIEITDDLVINGQNVTISAMNEYRHFYITSSINLSIKDLTLVNGNAGNGGSIHARNTSLILDNVSFSENTTYGSGGDVYIDNASAIIVNCNLEDITARNSSAYLENTTSNSVSLKTNSSFQSEGCDFGEVVSETNSKVDISKSYIDELVLNGRSAEVINTVAQSIKAYSGNNVIVNATVVGNIDFTGGTLNLNSSFADSISNPPTKEFRNIIGGDPLLLIEGGIPVGIQAGSPLVDAGGVSTWGLEAFDLNSNSRFLGDRIDVGAFEHGENLVVDNRDNGFNTYGDQSEWILEALEGWYDGDAFSGSGGESYGRFTLDLPNGLYQVSMTWLNDFSASPNVVISVNESLTSINQQLPPSDFTFQGSSWKTLGRYNVDSQYLVVDMPTQLDYNVFADAIFVQRLTT